MEMTVNAKDLTMNKDKQETNTDSIEKYKALISLISRTEDRLRLSELVYLFLNIIVMLYTISFVSGLVHKIDYVMTYIDYSLIFLCITGGMSINVYWSAYAMRVQMKLKLRYFQARSLERRFNSIAEYIFSDECIFFNPEIHRLESFDKKETVTYPTRGSLRMDGLIGSIKPRYFSWLLPTMFVFIYATIFIIVVTTI
jgi:hypothetical protein